ncbi:hypothetical protein N6H14_23145 [Paenibacillus sp. CC-CFT747]|nr:hypothetical protein N6H14_23145 [Paenibacillus sp. CC-CFT747]
MTLAQIDQEIERLSGQETVVSEQIRASGEDIQRQEQLLGRTRERVGQVLRAYYMGERDSLWLLLFSAKSFAEIIYTYNSLQLLFLNDKIVLDAYVTAYRTLLSTHDRLKANQAELAQVKAEFLHQRERTVALQQEIDRKMQEYPDAVPALTAQMNEVRTAYTTKILPLFQSYMGAVADTISRGIPELVQGPNAGRYLKGTTFQISDEELNRFFHEKNSRLTGLSFRFDGGKFHVIGKEADVEGTIVGHYTVEQNPNRLQFHVDQLSYNGTELDSTTNRSLETDFDLTFSPEKLSPLLQATEVTTEKGLLTVKLKIKL